MVDSQFSDPSLAALYDAFGANRRDIEFYLPLVMSARTVLDVGCGTGALLRGAREAGHTGRLIGLDPTEAMLQQARKRSDVEWRLGDLTSVRLERLFDIVVMTGHVFQVFLKDADVREALAAIRSALVPGGRLAFETRNRSARPWRTWTPDHAVEILDPTGVAVRMAHDVQTVDGEVVSLISTYTSPRWDAPKQSRTTLRFFDREQVSAFLSEAGFMIDDQYGDWDRTAPAITSPEIITIARRA